jgi:hypothetical protein
MKPQRPKAGTLGELPWVVADALKDELGRAPTRHEIKQEVYRRAPDYAPTTFNVAVAAWGKAQRDDPSTAERIAAALESIAESLRAQGGGEARAQLLEAAMGTWPASRQN